MSVLFSGDHHLGHANVIRYCQRPFESAEEMDEALVKRWNGIVRPKDLVYHLGDLCFHKPESAIKLVERLHGRIHLLRGNHDRPKVLTAIASRLEWVKDYHELTIDHQLMVLCHFPFLAWNKSHHGSWNLHGHSHGSRGVVTGPGRLDVGVDVHDFTPITFERVKELLTPTSDL